MKKTYKFLLKHLPIVLGCALATSAIGVIALILGYNDITSWLSLKGACTIIFIIFGLFSIGYVGYISYKTNDIHIKRIKKSSGFLRVCSCLAFAITLFIFGFELVKIILASYQSSFSEYFSVWRVLRFVFALPCSCYFLLMALPTKLKRRKVNIPKPIWYICSVSTILWAISGLLASYFSSQLSTMNILKIWQILVYLCFAVFFLFEAKFEHINQSPRAFIFTGCLALIVTMAFSLSSLICLAIGTISGHNSFSAPELICSVIIGLYAFSRIYAIPFTIKHVIETSDTHISSGEHKHHHHRHSSNSSSKSENQ